MRRRLLRRWLALPAAGLAGAAAWALLAGGPEVLDAPRPAAIAAEERLMAAPRSVLGAPLIIPLDRLTALLEEAVPRTFGSLEERRSVPGSDRTEIAFTLERGPFRVSMDGNVATVRADIEYALRAFYDPPLLPELSGSCGTDASDPRPRITLVLEAPLALTDSWALATRSSLVGLRPTTGQDRDRCQVSFLSIDVTEPLVAGAREFLEDQERTVDSIAASLDLRSSFDEWWGTLRDPIRLADSVWLVMGPDSVRRGPVRGAGDTVRVDLALQARPRIVIGPEPPRDTTPLPPLRAGEPVSGLNLLVDARVDYATASALLTERLKGTRLSREDRTIRLDSLEVTGIGGGRVALEVWISGDLSGHLFFTGTPAYDAREGVIAIPDLDFDVGTADLLVTAASWVGRLGLQALLRERARWSAAPAAAWMRGWLEEGLNRELSGDLRVVGAVDTLFASEVHALRDYFLVRVSAAASAEVAVRPAEAPGRAAGGGS